MIPLHRLFAFHLYFFSIALLHATLAPFAFILHPSHRLQAFNANDWQNRCISAFFFFSSKTPNRQLVLRLLTSCIPVQAFRALYLHIPLFYNPTSCLSRSGFFLPVRSNEVEPANARRNGGVEIAEMGSGCEIFDSEEFTRLSVRL